MQSENFPTSLMGWDPTGSMGRPTANLIQAYVNMQFGWLWVKACTGLRLGRLSLAGEPE